MGLSPLAGKGSASPNALGLKLLGTLPKALTARYEVMVLTDSAFCGVEFIKGVRKLDYHVVVGVRKDRRLQDGTNLQQLSYRGERVWLKVLDVGVYISSFWLKREGAKERRFVLSTKALQGRHIVRWGKSRWRIKGFLRPPRAVLACTASLRGASSKSTVT